MGGVYCHDESLAGSGNYAVGGVLTGNQFLSQSGSNLAIRAYSSFLPDGINESTLLPWFSEAADSGAPVYIWDAESGTYQWFGSNRGHIISAGAPSTAFLTDAGFNQSVEDKLRKLVDMSGKGTVYLNAVSKEGETIKNGDTVLTTLYSGSVTDASGELQSFIGLKTGLSTWGNLGGLKDTQNWYNYGDSYLLRSTEDLFYTENLVFSSSGNNNKIVLNATVDLGIGYAQFSLAEGASSARYDISSAGNGGYQFNHAGYVIDDGVEVHTTLTGDASHMYEWRKVGEGDLYIEGTGNNNILLNVGGSGKTYLNRAQGSYAAYNVLVNNGATIVISDADQIKRDLTFGNRGGTLELNGQSMDWYNTSETENDTRRGFSIHALTDDAIIANTAAGTASTLTYKEGSETTFLGSFVDSANSSLKIEHDADGTWVLHSVRTNLQHANSGLQVNQGTVVLSGTNTVHGTGSATGTNAERYFNEDDWHYADATMNVSVKNGGTFELGSHALLTGTVTVESGGTYVMRESVRHQMEYVEGGQILEDTSKYSAFFGHKGNVQLYGGTFAVQFNEGVDSTLYYDRAVTGSGVMTVDTGTDGGTLNFCGTVATTVSKTLERGQLVLSGDAAADTSNKWLVNAGGVMVQFDDVYNTLDVIDSESTGSIGLKEGVYTTQFDFSATHAELGIGALSGATVQYGAAGTTEKFSSINLGGGGKFVLNYLLADSESLNVNAGGMRGGEIHLANVAAGYSGVVNVQAAGGSITLTTAQDGALNGATVNLYEGGVWKLAEGQSSGGTVNVYAGGQMQGADVALTGGSVELYGNLVYDTFTVSNGATLNLREGGRLDAANAATISGTGVMRLNGQTLHDKVNLENGGTMYGNGGTIGTSATVLATEGTGKLNAGEGTLTVNGQIGAAEGATLVLAGNSVKINTINPDEARTGYINQSGGVLELQASAVELSHNNGSAAVNQYNVHQYIGGTLKIGADVSLTAYTGWTNILPTHHINHLLIAEGKTLSIYENSWNSYANKWIVDDLSGSGTINWTVVTKQSESVNSQFVLNGNNTFAGTVNVINNNTSTGNMQTIQLSGPSAGGSMVLALKGKNASNISALAVSTDSVGISGLSGNEYTALYAGNTTNRGIVTSSSRRSELVITGAGEYEFAGAVLGDATNGLSIVMEGTGTQTFTNSANVVHDVTALQGSLVFTATPTVYGDISIAQGAELTLGSGAFSLDAGQTLHVLAGAAGGAALLTNELVFNGGTLGFSVYDTSTPVLSIGGIGQAGESGILNLEFSNLKTIEKNVSYLLAAGDWSAFDNFNVTLKDSPYYQASITASDSGLGVSFGLHEKSVFWKGADTVLNPESIVIFTDEDDVNAAELPGGTAVYAGIFEHAGDYSIRSADGSAISFEIMEKYGAGRLILNSAVNTTTLKVMDAASISGAGALTVDTLELHADLTTGLAVDVTSISNGGAYTWTLDGSEREFSQKLSREQLASVKEVRVEGKATLDMTTTTTTTDPVTFTVSNISGDGTLALNLGKNHSNKLAIGDKFGGTTHVMNGWFTLNGSTFGDALRLGGTEADPVITSLNGTWTMDKNLVFDGTAQVHANGGSNTTFTGSVTGNGTYDSRGSGTVTFNGNVDLNSFVQTAAGVTTTVNFNGTTKLGSLTVSKGIVNIGPDATATIGKALSVTGGSFNIKENANLNIAAGAQATVNSLNVSTGGSVNIGAGATLDITTVQTSGDYNLANITGTGTLGVKLGTGYNQKLAIGSGFEGTTHVQLGKFVLSESTFGNTLRLGGSGTADNQVNMALNGTWTMDKDLVLDAVSQVHANSGSNTTFTGSVTGNGTYDSRGSGTVTFNGNVDLNSFVQTADKVVTTVNFNGTTKLGSLTVSAGTVNIGPDATATISETLSVTGGSVNIGAGATLKAAALSALGSSSIVVEKDATLEVEEISNEISFDNGRLSGQGLVVLNLSGETYQNVNLGSFSGETYVKSGSLSMNQATVGNTLRLADGVKLQASGTLAADLVLEGQTLVTPAGAANFNGTVTGNGTFVHESNQYFYFNKEVTLGGWVHDDGNTWGRDYFNAKADIGTVSLDGGHMYFYKGSVLGSLEVKQKNQQSLAEFSADSEHTVGTLSLENGIINANGTVEIGTYTQTGGTFTAAGSVVVKGRLNGTAGDIALKGGELKLSYTGEEGNSIYLLDGSIGGVAAGTLRLGQKVNLTVSSQIWGRSASSIVLEAGASLTSIEDGVVISNCQSGTDASLVCNANDGEYSVGNSDFELKNGYLKYDSPTDAELTNKLTNSVIENGNLGKAKLTVNNVANSLRGIVARGGDIAVLHQAELSLDILEVEGGKTVGLYTGTETEGETAAVSVSRSATFGAGASLNTVSLTLGDGATLEMTSTVDAVNLNGAALTFGSDLKLGKNLLAEVLALGCGETLTLFTGVSEFNMPASVADVSAPGNAVLASTYFADLADNQSVYVSFQKIDNVGSLMVINVPEPTTATLSLLALAGLCARRRRK